MKLDKKIKNVILVQDASDDDPAREKEKPLFDTVMLVGANNNPYSREEGTKIYLLKGAKVNINERIEKEMGTRKK